MAVVPGIDALTTDLGPLFFVVGVFDGLHRGHAYLLDELVRTAASHDARPAVVTFDHHPDEILVGAAPPLLCDPDERLARLEAAGAAVTVVQTFDVELRMTSYEAFVRRIAGRVALAGILMTPDSAFGNERRGTPAAVAALGAVMGYDVVVVPALELDGQPIRSGEIRSAIAAGDLARAARLLGRPYAVAGDASDSGDGRVAVSFSMPVAIPPPGAYPVSIESIDGRHSEPGTAVVGAAGEIAVGPGWAPGGRVRVVFG